VLGDATLDPAAVVGAALTASLSSAAGVAFRAVGGGVNGLRVAALRICGCGTFSCGSATLFGGKLAALLSGVVVAGID